MRTGTSNRHLDSASTLCLFVMCISGYCDNAPGIILYLALAAVPYYCTSWRPVFVTQSSPLFHVLAAFQRLPMRAFLNLRFLSTCSCLRFWES